MGAHHQPRQRANDLTVLVPGEVIAPSGRPLMPKRALLLLSSSAVGIPILVAPSSSMFPTIQHCLSTPSFLSRPPTGIPLALHQSMVALALAVIVAVIVLVVVLVASHAFGSPSRAEMMANVKSLGVAYSLGVCRSHVWQRLAPMSMQQVLGGVGMGIWPMFMALDGISGHRHRHRQLCSLSSYNYISNLSIDRFCDISRLSIDRSPE